MLSTVNGTDRPLHCRQTQLLHAKYSARRSQSKRLRHRVLVCRAGTHAVSAHHILFVADNKAGFSDRYMTHLQSKLLRCTGSSKQAKHAIVVGGGWAGFGAAYALLRAGVKVTILDASQTPGGLSAGWRTAEGRSVEAGIKGYSVLLHSTQSLLSPRHESLRRTATQCQLTLFMPSSMVAKEMQACD